MMNAWDMYEKVINRPGHFKMFAAVVLISFVIAHFIAVYFDYRRKREIKNVLNRIVNMNVSESNRVPVTILTGYLGAGKTTLVNSLLRQASLQDKSKKGNKRIGVVVNEMGDIAIDHDLIINDGDESSNGTNKDVILLSSGCVCCSISGINGQSELERVLTVFESLLKSPVQGDNNKDKDSDEESAKINHIIVECSGMVDVRPIIKIVYSLTVDNGPVYLDGIVSVVDAKHINKNLKMEEAVTQIASANVVLLNKIDLIENEKEISDCKTRILEINPLVKIIDCSYGKVSMDDVLNIQGFDLGSEKSTDALQKNVKNSNKYGDDHHQHSHTKGMESVSIYLDKPINWILLEKWIKEFVQLAGDNLFRMKGILHVIGYEDKEMIIQGVHTHIQAVLRNVVKSSNEASNKASRLVIIGRNLDKKKIIDDINKAIG